MNFKKTIAIDFDGVLNNYKGYDLKNLETPREGAREFLEQLSKDYTIIIFTCRDHTNVERWLYYYRLDKYVKQVTSTKPPAVAYIDDRAINFNGSYEEVLELLENFQPYWKQEEKEV